GMRFRKSVLDGEGMRFKKLMANQLSRLRKYKYIPWESSPVEERRDSDGGTSSDILEGEGMRFKRNYQDDVDSGDSSGEIEPGSISDGLGELGGSRRRLTGSRYSHRRNDHNVNHHNYNGYAPTGHKVYKRLSQIFKTSRKLN
ncbi:unnamed protein product, partial [Medioppia subpectinata]